MEAKYYTIFLAFFMGTIIFSSPSTESHSKAPEKFIKARIGSRSYVLEIADTYSKRAYGLSGRKKMARDKGMLFVFNKPVNYDFSMYNMQFPLDFLWVRDNRVVGLMKNISTKNTNAFAADE
ncbi:MAG: DUF192 domain-containing protein, partial [Candidatus Margulisbacteria bacterium]|nr:DUF192 domain-containing protein [Candidatus Margulisiibacteriota bacterium]